MKRLAFVVALALLSSASYAATQSYGVFCASGKIEIDSRSEEQMRSQRGACQFTRLPFRMDAEGFVKRNFGRVGASCSCR